MAVKGCSSKRIESVSLYKPKFSSSNGRKVKAFHVFFLACYVYVGYWVFSTVGGKYFTRFISIIFIQMLIFILCLEPYRKFLLKADREGFEG